MNENYYGKFLRVKPIIDVNRGSADLDSLNEGLLEKYREAAKQSVRVFFTEERFGPYGDRTLVDWLAENTARKKD